MYESFSEKQRERERERVYVHTRSGVAVESKAITRSGNQLFYKVDECKCGLMC